MYFFEKFWSTAQSQMMFSKKKMWLFIVQFEDVQYPVCIFTYVFIHLTYLCCKCVAEGLILHCQPDWRLKNGIFPINCIQSAPHTPPQPSLHLFLPSFSMKWEGMGFLQHEQRWHYCQHELPIVAVCQAGPLPSCCHHGAQMWWENFGEFIVEEIKRGTRLIWHPYLHGIRAVRQRQVSQLDQISNTYKICTGYIKHCPSTSPYEINMA